MYTIRDVCEKTGLTYQTVKFYCNEGLIPNVKRNPENNYREFDDNDIEWIKSLTCLKNCGMSIKEMKEYLELCLKGQSTISERKTILAKKREELLEKIKALKASVKYIDRKQGFYDDVLSGKSEYKSNLVGKKK